MTQIYVIKITITNNNNNYNYKRTLQDFDEVWRNLLNNQTYNMYLIIYLQTIKLTTYTFKYVFTWIIIIHCISCYRRYIYATDMNCYKTRHSTYYVKHEWQYFWPLTSEPVSYSLKCVFLHKDNFQCRRIVYRYITLWHMYQCNVVSM